MDAMYGLESEQPQDQILNVFVCRIRRRLGFGVLHGSCGAGFSLTMAGVQAVEAAIQTAALGAAA